MRGLIWTLFVGAFFLGGSAATADEPRAMPVGISTTQPIGHYGYCKRHPEDCRPVPAEALARFDDDMMATLRKVGRKVNHSVSPISDKEAWNTEEYWSTPRWGRGDCEDYALAKRILLRQAGIAVSNLLMTVVMRPNGEGHAVLVVTTDAGDFVLDNLHDRVLRWDATRYRFTKRQMAGDPGKWVAVGADTDGYLQVASTASR